MSRRAWQYLARIFTILFALFYVFDQYLSGWDILGLVFLTPLFTAMALFIASCKDKGTAENVLGGKTELFDSALLEVEQLPTTAREKLWLTAATWFIGLMLLFVVYLEVKAWFAH